MIKFIKSLREDISKRDIYIWNVNRSSMYLFADLAIMMVDVKGFVIPPGTDDSDKKTVMNRPLIGIEEFCNMDNAVLITYDDCVTVKEAKLPDRADVYYYGEDIFETDKNLFKKNVYIYGAGESAKKLTEQLKNEGIKISGYIAASNSRGGGIENAVRTYTPADYTDDDIIIISVDNLKSFNETITILKDAKPNIYIEAEYASAVMDKDNVAYYMDKAITENKKVFLLSDGLNFGNQIKDFLALYNIEIHNKDNYTIEYLYELLAQGEENFIVMVNEFDSVKRMKIYDELKNLGYSLDNCNINSFQRFVYTKSYIFQENTGIDDALAGLAQRYGSPANYGWRIMGASDNAVKIVILGGSTSTEDLFLPETWMKKLFKKLKRLSLNCTVYIGAAHSYTAVHEFLRFLRDGHIIKPDIVISMSGVNNTSVSHLKNKFNARFDDTNRYIIKNPEHVEGMPCDENCYEHWVRVEKIFKDYVNSLGAAFFPFLQPMNLWTPNATVESKMQTEFERSIVGAREFWQSATEDDFYINLLKIFYNRPDMFIDTCHYSDKGADILSDNVLKTILPTVKDIYVKNNIGACR